MPIELPVSHSLWTPPKPAIVRTAADLDRRDRRVIEKEFEVSFPTSEAMLPGMLPIPRQGFFGFNALEILEKLGQTTALQFCLDVGDAGSYDGSSQTWEDLNGVQDFYRGTTSGADASDPPFVGSAGGLSSGEYWLFDRTDLFHAVAGTPAWAQTLHQDGALWSAFVVGYLDTASANIRGWLSTAGSIGTDGNGVCWIVTSGETLLLRVGNNSGSAYVLAHSGPAMRAGWNFCGIGVDEAGASVLQYANGAVTTGDGTYASPSATNSDGILSLATCNTGASGSLDAGDRMSIAIMWQGSGAAKTKDDFDALTAAFADRYLR